MTAASTVPTTTKTKAPLATIPRVNSPEDLLNIGQEIRRLIQRKRQADEHLIELEARIYNLETEYFRETMPYGSIMTGLEGYLGLGTTQATSTVTPSGLRKSAYREVKDAARIFSNTSASSRRALMLYNKYATSQNPTQISTYDEDDSEDEAFAAAGDDDEEASPTRAVPSASSSSTQKKRSRPQPTPKRRK